MYQFRSERAATALNFTFLFATVTAFIALAEAKKTVFISPGINGSSGQGSIVTNTGFEACLKYISPKLPVPWQNKFFCSASSTDSDYDAKQKVFTVDNDYGQAVTLLQVADNPIANITTECIRSASNALLESCQNGTEIFINDLRHKNLMLSIYDGIAVALLICSVGVLLCLCMYEKYRDSSVNTRRQEPHEETTLLPSVSP